MAARSVAVIGAGIIGTVAACFLRREGHEVTLYDRDAPGSGASFGNSGVLSPAAVMPVAMPGLVRKVPRWLLDKTGPLYLDWRELPRLVPWLIAFLRAGREDRVRAISAALAALNGPTLDLLMPLLARSRPRRAGPEAGHALCRPDWAGRAPATASPSRCSGRRATGSRCSMPTAFATWSLSSRRGSPKACSCRRLRIPSTRTASSPGWQSISSAKAVR